MLVVLGELVFVGLEMRQSQTIARWYLAGGAVGGFRDAMIDGMTQLGGFMNPESQEILMYISRISSRGTLFIGTAMTIFFVWYTYNNQRQRVT